MTSKFEPFIGVGIKPKETKPPSFPMKFKECLRRVIGGRLHGERLHFFRRYWCDTLQHYEFYDRVSPKEKNAEGRLKKANEMIEKFTAEGVDEHWFNTISKGFPIWRGLNRIKQRKDAANKRWKK